MYVSVCLRVAIASLVDFLSDTNMSRKETPFLLEQHTIVSVSHVKCTSIDAKSTPTLLGKFLPGSFLPTCSVPRLFTCDIALEFVNLNASKSPQIFEDLPTYVSFGLKGLSLFKGKQGGDRWQTRGRCFRKKSTARLSPLRALTHNHYESPT